MNGNCFWHGGDTLEATSGKLTRLKIAPQRRTVSREAIFCTAETLLNIETLEAQHTENICHGVPLRLSIHQLGNPEIDQPIRTALDELFTQYPGEWDVDILGSMNNSAWELKVTSPKRHSAWANKLYGEDGGHNVEKVIFEVRRITERLSLEES